VLVEIIADCVFQLAHAPEHAAANALRRDLSEKQSRRVSVRLEFTRFGGRLKSIEGGCRDLQRPALAIRDVLQTDSILVSVTHQYITVAYFRPGESSTFSS